jgi:poly(A) polymerase
MRARQFAIEVVRRLQEAGHQALWAGGCVRDGLLGLVPSDYDIATDATSEQVRPLFPRTGAPRVSGAVEVLGPPDDPPLKVQVASFRTERGSAGRGRPDEGAFTTARTDALRRDFTINGLFLDPLTGEVFDYVGGRADLEVKRLRTIGEPAGRFREDRLRPLQAVRLAARFGLAIEPATWEALRRQAPQLGAAGAERVVNELRPMLVHPRRVAALGLLYDSGLCAALLPEVVPMKGLPQGRPGAPAGDLWDHVMRVLDRLGPAPSFALALAALLHDVGKPRTVGRTPDRYTFYYHEHVGARMAEAVCRRLRLPAAEGERIVWLVEKHQILCDARHMRTGKLKALLTHPGVRELLELHRADAQAWGHGTDHVDYAESLLREWTEADLNPPPLLTGHDLTRRGLEPGPRFQALLDAVREAQLDGTITTARQALEVVDRLLTDGSAPDREDC